MPKRTREDEHIPAAIEMDRVDQHHRMRELAAAGQAPWQKIEPLADPTPARKPRWEPVGRRRP